MLRLIATITLMGALTGIAVILARKIPELRKLKESKEEKNLRAVLSQFCSRIKSSRFFQPDFFEGLLQKLLSKIKVLAIKVENKCSQRLQKMREKSAQRKKAKNDTYWKKLKKSLKSKKRK